MFGYVIPNEKLLDDEQKKLYRSFYCGLCRTIGERYGTLPRLTLNYELTFLALVLSASEGEAPPSGKGGCLIHPLKKNGYVKNPCVEYAADMTILLASAKAMDDKRDEHAPGAACTLAMLKKAEKKAAQLHPELKETMDGCLSRLTAFEDAGETNPDLPAGCFGELLAQVFACGTKNGEKKQPFARFGFLFGKFLYMMDAAVDLKSDLRHKRYNPLASYPVSLRREMLDLMMADVEKAYGELGITAYSELIKNILLSGIWIRYEMKYKMKEKEAGEDDQ